MKVKRFTALLLILILCIGMISASAEEVYPDMMQNGEVEVEVENKVENETETEQDAVTEEETETESEHETMIVETDTETITSRMYPAMVIHLQQQKVYPVQLETVQHQR